MSGGVCRGGKVCTVAAGVPRNARRGAVVVPSWLVLTERQPELRAQLSAIYEQSRASVAAMITEIIGVPAGPARALATFQIVVCDGLLVQWLLDPDATPSGAELTDAFMLALGQDQGS